MPIPSKKRAASRAPEARQVKKVRLTQAYALARTAERKRKYYGLAPLTARSDSIYLYNPLYYLVTGGLRDQRLGNRISGAYLHYSMSLTPLALNALGDPVDQGVAARIVVFRHTKEWNSASEGAWAINTGGSGITISTSDVVKDIGTDRLCQSYLNVDEIRVLHDRVVMLPRPELGGTATDANGPHKIVKGMIRLGDIRLNDGTNAYSRDPNVYVAVMAASSSGNTLPEAVRVATNFLLTWNDM